MLCIHTLCLSVRSFFNKDTKRSEPRLPNKNNTSLQNQHFERSSLLYSIWHTGERSWQILAGWNSRSLSCLLTGKWVGTQAYLYFLKQPAETHECFCWRKARACQPANTKEDKLNQNLLTLASLPQLSYFRLKYKLTNFKSCLLSRAVVVHLAHKRAHFNGVLVLMVQAVGLRDTETITLNNGN